MRTRTNRQKWIAGIAVFLVSFFLIPMNFVQGASATITLSTEIEEIQVGDVVEIQLVLTADTMIGDFEAVLQYDDTILQLDSAPSCITKEEGALRIADIGASPSPQDRIYHIYFQAIKQGECEFVLYERPVVYSYSDGTEMSVISFSKTFYVYPANEEVSSDSSLSALMLTDNLQREIVITPEFSSETNIYFSAVDFLTSSLIMDAIPTDSKASITIVGGDELVIGNNEIAITVTAENGEETIYTVYIYRVNEQEDVQQSPIQEIEIEVGITAKLVEDTIQFTEYHTYTVCEKPEDFVVPEGYVQTILMIDGVQSKAYVKQGDTKEQFLLLVLKNEAGEINWYRYDRAEQTLQTVCEEEYVITQIVQQEEGELQTALLQYEKQQKEFIYLVALLLAIIVVLFIIILWLCIRNRNRG